MMEGPGASQVALFNLGLSKYADIAGGLLEDGTQPILYEVLHWGPNQVWELDSRTGQLSPMLLSRSRKSHLSVRKEAFSQRDPSSAGVKCELTFNPTSSDLHCSGWTFSSSEDGAASSGIIIALREHPEYVLSASTDGLLIVSRLANDDKEKVACQRWQLIRRHSGCPEEPAKALPASSCHLRYPVDLGAIEGMALEDWELKCTVNVIESAGCTYFCVLGWNGHSGGYAGIQELDGGEKVAIFSLWDDAEAGHEARLVDKSDGVKVERFGGEGEGLKSMKRFDWELGQDVTFTVRGSKVDRTRSKDDFRWRISCSYETDKEEPHHMATFEMVGRGPESPLGTIRNGFYSFVEDWDRSPGARGHLVRRKAVFKKPTCSVWGWVRSDRKVVVQRHFNVRGPNCTRITHGDDEFACHKVHHHLDVENQEFGMETGGDCAD